MTLDPYTLDPDERIEEAHGLWELAAARVCALSEAIVATDGKAAVHELLIAAVELERSAFEHWREISAAAVAEKAIAHLAGGSR
jgi:hypothetical protein